MSGTQRLSAPAFGLKAGSVVAKKYQLLEPLGAGGMGEVWIAQNLATGGEVALKMLHPTRPRSVEGTVRFRREAYVTAQLSHRNIVRIFDLVELPDEQGSLAMAMELLRGKTLADRIRHEGPLGLEAMMAILLPILSALHYAHGVGIIHRDLKPENIFLHLEPDGQVIPKLFDFGVSRMLRVRSAPITAVGEIVGTPNHMSPEQVRGVPVDARSDVFCAGVLVYACLTGRSPFARETPVSSMLAILGLDPIRPPQMCSALWRVIACSLEKDPNDRFSNAAEFAGALARLTRDAPPATTAAGSSTAPAISGSRPEARAARETRLQVAGIAIAASVVGLTFASIDSLHAAPAGRHFEHEGAQLVLRAKSKQLRPSLDVLELGEIDPREAKVQTRAKSMLRTSGPRSIFSRIATRPGF